MYTGFMADLWLAMLLLVGGTVGTVCTVQRARGSCERRLLLWICASLWLAAIVFVVGILSIPRPFGVLLWVPYGVGVPIGVSFFRGRLRHARANDGTTRRERD